MVNHQLMKWTSTLMNLLVYHPGDENVIFDTALCDMNVALPVEGNCIYAATL